MFRKHEIIPSQAMGRGINLWRYGHFGPPVVVFPSASGMAHEWDAHGLVEALGDFLGAGKLKLYCVESNVAEAWTRKDNPPAWRIKRHLAYEQFLLHDLVPFIRRDCLNAEIPIAVTGTSLGALYSANCVLKYPQIFRWGLCMSGRYDATWLTDGYSDQDVYFNNPMAYLANMQGELLELLRNRAHVVLVCGQGKWEDGNVEDTIRLADLLKAKGISHERDIWGHDVSHEWVWWRRQARFHLERYIRHVEGRR